MHKCCIHMKNTLQILWSLLAVMMLPNPMYELLIFVLKSGIKLCLAHQYKHSIYFLMTWPCTAYSTNLVVVGDLESCLCLAANQYIVEDKAVLIFSINTATLHCVTVLPDAEVFTDVMLLKDGANVCYFNSWNTCLSYQLVRYAIWMVIRITTCDVNGKLLKSWSQYSINRSVYIFCFMDRFMHICTLNGTATLQTNSGKVKHWGGFGQLWPLMGVSSSVSSDNIQRSPGTFSLLCS